MTLTDLHTHFFFFFFGKGKGLNLQESNPSDTEDVTECAGKKGRHTESHRHLYASPPALTAGLGESLFAGLESLYRPPERRCSPLGKDGLGAKDEFLDL